MGCGTARLNVGYHSLYLVSVSSVIQPVTKNMCNTL